MFFYQKNYQIFATIQFVIVLFIALLLFFFLRNKKDIVRKIPIFVILGIIIVLEIHKQFRNFAGYECRLLWGYSRGITSEFLKYALPFHFCSLFIFLGLFSLVFYKIKKLRVFFENMTFLSGLMITIITFFNIDVIYGGPIDYLFTDGEFTHTLLFHSLVILYTACAFALKTYSFEIKKIWHPSVMILVFGAIAIPAAHLLKENYCNILWPGGMDALKPIYEKGYVVYDGFIVLVGCISATLIYLLIYGIEKLRKSIKYPKWFFYGFCAFTILVPAFYGISALTKYDVLAPFYAIYLFALFVLSLTPGIIKNFVLKNKD